MVCRPRWAPGRQKSSTSLPAVSFSLCPGSALRPARVAGGGAIRLPPTRAAPISLGKARDSVPKPAPNATVLCRIFRRLLHTGQPTGCPPLPQASEARPLGLDAPVRHPSRPCLGGQRNKTHPAGCGLENRVTPGRKLPPRFSTARRAQPPSPTPPERPAHTPESCPCAREFCTAWLRTTRRGAEYPPATMGTPRLPLTAPRTGRATLFSLKTVALELQRPAVLSEHPHELVRRAPRQARLDFQRHADLRTRLAGETRRPQLPSLVPQRNRLASRSAMSCRVGIVLPRLPLISPSRATAASNTSAPERPPAWNTNWSTLAQRAASSCRSAISRRLPP